MGGKEEKEGLRVKDAYMKILFYVEDGCSPSIQEWKDKLKTRRERYQKMPKFKKILPLNLGGILGVVFTTLGTVALFTLSV